LKKPQVVVDFSRFSIPEKIDFFNNVLTHLADNPDYTTPDISIADAQLSVDNLVLAALAAHDGSHINISLRNDAEKIADKDIRILAAYVQRTADGNISKILSSGFHGSQQQSAIQKAVLAIKDGPISGSIIYVVKAVDKTGAYIWQYYEGETPPATEAEWITAGHSTSATFQVNGLNKAKVYQFRFAAITTTGTTDFSAPVSKIVL
jgi:hypothetical protein